MLILLCGIGSWVLFPFVLGVVAWAMSNSAMRDVTRGSIPESDRPLIQIGKVLGMANVILIVLAVGTVAGLTIAGIKVPGLLGN